LIVSQQRQSSCPPHRTCPRPSQGPPRDPEGSTPAGAPPRAASLRHEPDLPLPTRLSYAAQSRGGGRSSGRRSAHPERAAVGCGVIEVIGLKVMAAINPHQLIV
jgi:hypothetical protein